MRILVVSNIYPPHFLGGYEIACKEAVDGLRTRGHDVKVLTSTYGEAAKRIDGDVFRYLFQYLAPARHGLHHLAKVMTGEIHDQRCFRRICKDFRPDVIFFWNLGCISVSLVFIAQELRIPTAFYVFDDWLSKWQSDHWYSFLRKGLLRRTIFASVSALFNLTRMRQPLCLTHAIFASSYLRSLSEGAGISRSQQSVVHWGINTSLFRYKPESPCVPRKLLYVGQVVQLKGVHTLIKALDVLVNREGRGDLTLTIAGDIHHSPKYVETLKGLIRAAGLDGHVLFVGKRDHRDLPEVYIDHDIFIFPSVWDEPFGITQVEAMACGLPVVGTATGGSAEILSDAVNALVFQREDFEQCAANILKLLRNPDVYQAIRSRGRKTAELEFDFDRQMRLLEGSLLAAANQKEGPIPEL